MCIVKVFKFINNEMVTYKEFHKGVPIYITTFLFDRKVLMEQSGVNNLDIELCK